MRALGDSCRMNLREQLNGLQKRDRLGLVLHLYRLVAQFYIYMGSA